MRSQFFQEIFRSLRAGIVLSLLGVLPATCGFSNVYEMVMATGATGGDAVWKVVTDSDRGDTDLRPGIYTRGPEQNWEHPLVLGNLLGREHASGLVQLSLTDYTSRLEAFGVIDGVITFFTVGSDVKDPSSVVRVGGKDYPVRDPSQPFLKEVRLPPVQSLDDISYLTEDPSGYPRSQKIVFSVRNPYSPFEGMDGLTFVVTLKGDSPLSNSLALAGPALILDYRFHSNEQLQELETRYGYVAQSYIDRLTWEQKQDSLPLKTWRRNLKEKMETRDFKDVPYLNPETGLFTLAPKRSFKVHKGRNWPYLKVESHFSVEGGLPGLKFERRSKEKVLTGQIDFYPGAFELKNPDLKDLGDHVVFVTDDDDSCLFFLDGELYYLRSDSRGNFSFLKISEPPLDGDIPDRLSFYVLKREGESRIMISASLKQKAETRVYQILELKSDFYVKGLFSVSRKFFSSSELKSRLYQDEQILYFDESTDTTRQSYRSAYDDTVAHIDIEKSLEAQKPCIGFRKPVKTRVIGEKTRYFYYNQSGLTENTNGLYYTAESGITEKMELGELLYKAVQRSAGQDDAAPREDTPVLASQKIPMQSDTVSMNVIAVDESHQGGENGFTLMLIAEYAGKNYKPELQKVRIKRPFSSLSEVLVHGGLVPEGSEGNFAGLMLSFLSDNPESPVQEILKIDTLITKSVSSSSKVMPVRFRVSQKNIKLKKQQPGKDVLDGIRSSLLTNAVEFDGSGHISKVVYGQILKSRFFHSALSVQSGEVLTQKEFVHPDWGPVSVRIWAVDEQFQGGETSFTLVFEARRLENGITEYFSKNLALPVSALTGLSLIDRSEFGRFRDWFGIIYGLDFDAQALNIRQKPGFYSLFFTMKKQDKQTSQRNIFFATPLEVQQEQIEHPSLEELEYKLLMDHEGRLFWPASENGRSHRMFQVLSLFEGRHLYPNQERLRLESANRVSELVGLKVEEGSWRVRKAPYLPSLLPGMFGRLEKENNEEYQNVIFEDLSRHFEDLGNPGAEGEHSILLVSKEGKRYVMNSFAAKWLNKRSQGSYWSSENRKLALYFFNRDQYVDQEVVAKNFRAAEQALDRKEKVVLLVDAADIIAAGKLKEGGIDKPYVISVPEERDRKEDDGSLNQIFPDSGVDFQEESASLLYILASEGRNISLKEFPDRGKSEISITLVGTEKEWDEIKRSISPFERNAGLLKDFAIKTLKTPSMEQRRNLLLRVLEDKKPLFNGIRFDGYKIFVSHKPLSEEEVRNKVIDYAVSRSQALAMEKGENVFVSFVRLLEKFKASLHPGAAGEDDGILSIDKAFIENLMRVLYNLALNLSTLPPSDPLKILEKKDAPLKLNEAGYAGNFDIKMRVIRGLLAQTNSGDQKTIPASFVIFGKKGSGKTFLFKTLVKMLGLKYYDFSAGEDVNQGAQVFMINMGNVTARGSLSDDSETMGVDTLLRKFDLFLKSPLGSRGFILVDDAHLASSEVRGMIFSKLRSLFEAKDGMYQGVSVRNLALFMTFNPTIDRDKISKVVESGKPTPLELTLATFLGEDNKVDESFFNRWGDIINLDYFSTSAKGNELVNKLSETAKSHFSVENSYFSVTPDVIGNIVESFPRLNARDFLSSSVKSLLEMLRGGHEYNSLYLIVPRARLPFRGKWNYKPHAGSGEAGSEDVINFIGDNFYGLPVKGDLRGYVWFLEMISSNFRVNLYRQLITGLNSSQSMSGTEFSQKYKLGPVLEAVRDHLQENAKIPLTEYSLDQFLIKKFLGISRMESVERFIYDMYEDAENQSYFPEIFGRNTQSDHLASYLLGNVNNLSNQPTRLNLLYQAPRALKAPLEDFLMNLLRVRSKSELHPGKIQEWAAGLTPADQRQNAGTGRILADNLNGFLESFFNDMRLIENMQPDEYEAASFYDVTRVWLYILDKSVTMMSWEQLSVWLIKVLDTLSQDMSISTNPAVQHWLFEASDTVIRPASVEGIFESVKSSLIGVGEWRQKDRSRFQKDFYRKLSGLFYDAEK